MPPTRKRPKRRSPAPAHRRRARTPAPGGLVTSHDVASLAGVSRSAVSRTFTPDASVSEKTRRKVHAGRSLDVLLRLPDQLVAIELKYLVKRQEVTVDGEEFRLKNQSAHDIRRYDTVKDITRIEELVEAGAVDTGFVIVASNDSAYWSQSRERSTPVNDAAFRLDDGRELAGELAWCATTGAGTMESREKPLVLTGAYSLAWDDFARVGDDLFRYLLISVR